jgi:hypothetical protein
LTTKKYIEEQFMSSQSFHQITGGRVRENTTEKQFKSKIFECFDPVTQESLHLPALSANQEKLIHLSSNHGRQSKRQ